MSDITDWTTDPTRPEPESAPQATYAEALEFYAHMMRQAVPTRLFRIMQAMVEEVDRQRGEGAGAKRVGSHPMMSYTEARSVYDGMEWRSIRTRTHRAMDAMAKEIDRLQINLVIQRSEIDRLRAEHERLIAALPEVIGCKDGLACSQYGYGWFSCCLARIALARRGLIPALMQQDEMGDGA